MLHPYDNDDILVGMDIPAAQADTKAVAVVPLSTTALKPVVPSFSAALKNPYVIAAAVILIVLVLKRK